MNTLLWIGQIILAIIFMFSGINKSIYSEKELIAKGQTGVVGLSSATIRFIGICEILGAIGIIIPWWTGILPILTPVTALGFGTLMILAAPRHHRLKEPKNVAINMSILTLSLLVAIGRFCDL
jgi:hypothetical protein